MPKRIVQNRKWPIRSPAMCLGVAGLLFALGGCSPPDRNLLDACRQSAAARGHDLNLTKSDLGELVEECMSKRGYALRKNHKGCMHDFPSATARRCYYPDTTLGHLYDDLT